MKRPRLTRAAFEGLISAVSRMEADDLTDLPDLEQIELDAARQWLQKMSLFFCVQNEEESK
jgi:hypothetical protein